MSLFVSLFTLFSLTWLSVCLFLSFFLPPHERKICCLLIWMVKVARGKRFSMFHLEVTAWTLKTWTCREALAWQCIWATTPLSGSCCPPSLLPPSTALFPWQHIPDTSCVDVTGGRHWGTCRAFWLANKTGAMTRIFSCMWGYPDFLSKNIFRNRRHTSVNCTRERILSLLCHAFLRM